MRSLVVHDRSTQIHFHSWSLFVVIRTAVLGFFDFFAVVLCLLHVK